jgi:hypothetical protein
MFKKVHFYLFLINMSYPRQTPNILLHRLIILIFFNLMFVEHSPAQKAQPIPYNLNVSTHLPSDHIYGSVLDQLGYLWVTTPKGVVRYNGYEARLFNVSNGLPSDDVWYLLEDRAGRMWVCSMTYELGYIQNNRYHAVIKKTQGFIIPRIMVRYHDGIAVNTSVYELSTGNSVQQLILFNNNLGLKVINIPANFGELFLNKDSGFSILLNGNLFYQSRITDNGLLWAPAKKLAEEELQKFGTNLVSKQLFRNKLYYIARNSDRFGFLNTQTGKMEEVICPFKQSDEKTVFGYVKDSCYTVTSTKGAYLFDSLNKLVAHYPYASLTGNEKVYDVQPCIFYDCPLWGLTLGTSDMGIYIRSKDSSAFIPVKELDLDGYGFIGSPHSNLGVWWHAGKHQMKIVYEDAKVVQLKVPYLNQVTGMSSGIDGHVLLSTDRGYIWLQWNPPGLPVFPKDKSEITRLPILLTPPAALNRDSVFTIVSGGPYVFAGYFKGQYQKLSDVYFNKMTLDKGRYGVWLYRNQMAAFYDIKKNTFRFFYPDILRKIGLRKIEEIAVDKKYGNVFVKDYDGMYLVDENFSHAQPLFPHLRCNNARLLVQDDNLLVAGRFGLLCCKITGKGKLGKPQWQENFKDIYYKQVYGLQLMGTWAILNTDKGTYRVSLNALSRPGEKDPGYRFIVYSPEGATRINAYDTLILQPGTPSIQWDVINPKGTGKLELAYLNKESEASWQVLSGNEINISGFLPGKWNKLYLKARDDIWQSEPLPVLVYLRPYWWQTTFFLLLIICCSILLAVFVVLITRRVVIRKQKEKQQVVEMGLAGIYAQINPHFIFNSLNTAQFFIKANQMQEAYGHINRFSKLLRSFLHASKHRYITIEEEVGNLKNYIELQQTRFTESFDYTINLLPEIDTTLKIPSLLLQPLVENAIQHGLFNRKEKGGVLSLTFEKEKEHLVITIEDNGIGRALAKEMRHSVEKKESYGNDLIQKLIFVFNKYEKIDINLSYIDKMEPETGTIVKVVISYPLV